MKKAIITVAVVTVAGVSYWLISPSFIGKDLNEVLSPDEQQAVEQLVVDLEQQQDEEGDGKKEMTMEKMVDILAEQIAIDRREAFKDKMMRAYQGVTVVEPMPIDQEELGQQKNGPAILFFGNFLDLANNGNGTAKIIDLGSDAGRILRLEDLNLLNGPDLRILLSENSNITGKAGLGDHFEVAKLKGNKGNQNYVLPNNLDLTKYRSVVIYSKKFGVVFNAVNLAPLTK